MTYACCAVAIRRAANGRGEELFVMEVVVSLCHAGGLIKNLGTPT